MTRFRPGTATRVHRRPARVRALLVDLVAAGAPALGSGAAEV